MATPTHPLQAFSLAVLLEIILLLGVGVVMAGSENEKPVLKPVTITLLEEEKPVEKPPEKPPEPKLPKPKVMQSKRQTPRPVTPPPVAQVLPVASVPTAFTRPVPPPPVAPAPAPASAPDTSKAKISEIYAAKVHAAVQTAHNYPPAAAALHFSGRVRVEFHLRDGVPGNPRLLEPSGYGIIDRSALSAVQNAHYPEPPHELRGEDIVYQVWVEFNLQ